MNSLLKFITCGSVDDGKSTLIGHMLYDAKLLFADQKKALELESRMISGSGIIDYSLLLDGLIAEREQKITIDVAYRYFTTRKRSFIVADTPGHEEYTRNMAVGASFADLAIILVDILHGLVKQTKRHLRICALMGIKHFVFAVNKMDLVDYDYKCFASIKSEIEILMQEFDYKSLQIIPVSATEGDNVTKCSSKMVWYQGGSLLNYLEGIDVESDSFEKDFVMPVQRVSRPNASFRGYQGQIESGKIALGDEIVVLPSKESAKISSILESGKEVSQSDAGHAVTLTLSREIDVSRGCVFAKGQSPALSNCFTAQILWLDDDCLERGKDYILKLGTKTIPAIVKEICYKTEIDTGQIIQVNHICKNEIAVCDLLVSERIVIDLFLNNKVLGSLILINRITNMTVACGVVVSKLSNSNNLFQYNMDINREYRARQMNQVPKTIWMTGLSGAGKSTLANYLEKKLVVMGKHTMILDGDSVRMGLNSDLGFTDSDRAENIRRIAEVAKILNDAGIIVITSFISPIAKDREKAKLTIGSENFIEVYVNAPLSVCEKRDTNGLYKKARLGSVSHFTGISSPYEIPTHPDIEVDTSRLSIEDCVDIIFNQIKEYV